MGLNGEPVSKESNILDPVQDSLDEAVFDGAGGPDPRLKGPVAEFARRKISNAMHEGGFGQVAYRLILTGSLTTYQWSEASDFDVSLWVDPETLPEDARRGDIVRLMIDKVDGTIVPGSTHPMQDFVVDWRENTTDDLYRPGVRSAWDLDAGRWIVPPERDRVQDVQKTLPDAYHKAALVADKMSTMLDRHPKHVAQMWDRIHGKRHSDMANGLGDFAESNIVYKFMANKGMFPLIAAATGKYLAKVAAAVPEDEWEHKGRPFTVGVVDLRDGVIEHTLPKAKAEAADWHHTFFLPDEHYENVEQGTHDVFWMDGKRPRSMEGLPYSIQTRILEQVTPRAKTAGWDYHQDDEGVPPDDVPDDQRRWMYGRCSEYATALHRRNPDLKFGMWVQHHPATEDPDESPFRDAHEGYTPFHVFVHDDEHAYDVMGTHKLPYEADHPDLESRYGLSREDVVGQWGESEPEEEDEAIAHWEQRHAGELVDLGGEREKREREKIRGELAISEGVWSQIEEMERATLKQQMKLDSADWHDHAEGQEDVILGEDEHPTGNFVVGEHGHMYDRGDPDKNAHWHESDVVRYEHEGERYVSPKYKGECSSCGASPMAEGPDGEYPWCPRGGTHEGRLSHEYVHPQTGEPQRHVHDPTNEVPYYEKPITYTVDYPKGTCGVCGTEGVSVRKRYKNDDRLWCQKCEREDVEAFEHGQAVRNLGPDAADQLKEDRKRGLARIAMPADREFLDSLEFKHNVIKGWDGPLDMHTLVAEYEGAPAKEIGHLHWPVGPKDICHRCTHKESSHDELGCAGDQEEGCDCDDDGGEMYGPYVADLEVEHDYHHRGVATELWNRAKAIQPDLDHDEWKMITDEGKGWVKSLESGKKAGADDLRQVMEEERAKLLKFQDDQLRDYPHLRTHPGPTVPWDINNGLCEEFSEAVAARVPGATPLSEIDCGNPDHNPLDDDGFPESVHPGHAWVQYDGKHYDAESLRGRRRSSPAADFPRGGEPPPEDSGEVLRPPRPQLSHRDVEPQGSAVGERRIEQPQR